MIDSETAGEPDGHGQWDVMPPGLGGFVINSLIDPSGRLIEENVDKYIAAADAASAVLPSDGSEPDPNQLKDANRIVTVLIDELGWNGGDDWPHQATETLRVLGIRLRRMARNRPEAFREFLEQARSPEGGPTVW